MGQRESWWQRKGETPSACAEGLRRERDRERERERERERITEKHWDSKRGQKEGDRKRGKDRKNRDTETRDRSSLKTQ
jgi:hypothetical protein